MRKREAFLLSFLITLLFAINFSFFNFSSQTERRAFVTRVLDGDTLEVNYNETIRLLNINTREKSEPFSDFSTSFLKKLVNRTIKLQTLGRGKYGRTLARIYYPEYINLEIVSKGLGNKFLVEENELKKFDDSEKSAIKKSLGIWKKSPFFGCFTAKIYPKKELIILKNNCGEISLNGWIIKDESRKKYIIQNKKIIKAIRIYSSYGESNATTMFLSSKNIWNNDRDTFYLWDDNWSLAYYESYGY